MDMGLTLITWIMARPNDACGWFIGPERTLRAFKMAEPVLQIGDMMMNALGILPPVCFCLCLECQEKGINILSRKGLQRLGRRILLEEKDEKITETIGASMKRRHGDTGRQSAFDVVLDSRTKHLWDPLKINVVVGRMGCIAQSWDQSGIPFLF